MRSEIERVKSALASYAARHEGSFTVFGSAARGELRHDSDLDILVDFPADMEREARDFAERACIEYGIKPDLHLASDASRELLDRIASGSDADRTSDDGWIDVETEIAAASLHFGNACGLHEAGGFEAEGIDGYRARMALVHSLQCAQISAEAGLFRLMRLLDEEAPQGEDRDHRLVERLRVAVEGDRGRPAVLPDEVAGDLHEARVFMRRAVRGCGEFDGVDAAPAIAAAGRLVTSLPYAMDVFKRWVLSVSQARHGM